MVAAGRITLLLFLLSEAGCRRREAEGVFLLFLAIAGVRSAAPPPSPSTRFSLAESGMPSLVPLWPLSSFFRGGDRDPPPHHAATAPRTPPPPFFLAGVLVGGLRETT